MKHLHLHLLLMAASFLFLVVATSRDAQGAGHCSVRDRIQLGQAGYAKVEVDDLCNQSGSTIPPSSHWSILAGEGQPRWVQWCVTPQGRCSLNPATSGFYPFGAACNCYMPWGSYGGVAQ